MTTREPMASVPAPTWVVFGDEQRRQLEAWLRAAAAEHGLEDLVVRWEEDRASSEALLEHGQPVVAMSLRECGSVAEARNTAARELGHLVLGHQAPRRHALRVVGVTLVAAAWLVATIVLWAVAAHALAAGGASMLLARRVGLLCGAVLGLIVGGWITRGFFLATNVREEYAADDFAQRYEPFTWQMAQRCQDRDNPNQRLGARFLRWLVPTHPTWNDRAIRQTHTTEGSAGQNP